MIAYQLTLDERPGYLHAKVAETVAVNRAVNVRLFEDVAQAAAWLAPAPKR